MVRGELEVASHFVFVSVSVSVCQSVSLSLSRYVSLSLSLSLSLLQVGELLGDGNVVQPTTVP